MRQGVDELRGAGSCVDDLVQAVDEAATNIIRYGYRGKTGTIELTAELGRA